MLTKISARAAASAVCFVILSVCGVSHAQQAWTFNQAFAFDGAIGAVPVNNDLLIVGNQIYGETYAGGANDLGAIYSYGTTGSGPTNLYSFTGPEGSHPRGGLVRDAQGNLYGTTPTGGANNQGTVFKLSPAGQLTTLHSFAQVAGANPGNGLPDEGANPMNGVALGPDGYLYGATYSGGLLQGGTIFKIATDGTGFRVMTSIPFTSGSQTNVVVDPQGNVIGTTTGYTTARQAGALFLVSPAGGLRGVADFVSSEVPNAVNLGIPHGHLIRDTTGNVYGVALFTANDASGGPAQRGSAVFEVTAVTHLLKIRALFPNETIQSGVIQDATGNLYGATVNGGAIGAGSVFMISPSNQVTTLASLPVGNIAPAGSLALDATGELWGTSSSGGQACGSSASVAPVGCGTLFNLSP